jgi:hypothetical protein
MRVQNPKKFRRLIAGRCRYCDRRFFYRHPGRPRTYFDHKCRQAEFRYSGYLHPKRDENPLKNSTGSKVSKVDLVDLDSPNPTSRWTPSWDATWPSDDLPIPPFLQRRRT